MALSLATTATATEKSLTQVIEAMFAAQPGHTILKALAADANANSINALTNALVAFADNTDTAESFTKAIVANIGISTTTGLTALQVTDAEIYVLAQLNTAGKAGWGAAVLAIVTDFSGMTAHAVYGAAAKAFNGSVVESLNYSLDSANLDPYYGPATSGVFNLTTGLDTLMGTVGDDSFIARIVDNANTAQSGDMIKGGAGNDTLTADIGNSQNFAITLETNSVENFVVRTQANASDAAQNNPSVETTNVQIDAQRMEGTNRYELRDGRADLIVEDVRIENTQITKDITIAMVQTDPGDVDFGVYFDQHSLRKQGDATTDSLVLSVSNQLRISEGFDATKPLDNIPYDRLAFVINGERVILNIDTKAVDTYDQMWAVVEAAFNLEKTTNPLLANASLVRLAGAEAFIAKDGDARIADEYKITVADATIVPSNPGWSISEGTTLPENNAFAARMAQGQTTSASANITAEIILDDVGRGSNGGDLVVGGLSTGLTSDSKGVEQFNIHVDRDSKLGVINSTNNTLREVYIDNRDNNADSDTTATGGLWVNGNNVGLSNELPGDTTQDNAFGFSDVRVIDASTMVGSVNLTAELTNAVTAKFMDRVDTNGNPKADNMVNGDFNYTMGTADDSFALTISSANLDAAGTTTREDFTLNLAGGAGNDTLTTIIGSGSGLQNTPWYINSKENANLNVSGGDGNDTITTTGAGDVKINGDAGNDTIYTDNSGSQKATWVFNTLGDNSAASNLIDNLVGNTLQTVDLYKGQLTVNFRGLTKTVDIASNTSHKTTSLNVNNAIKDAINNDAILNKLLIAQDGPANTLVVTSLIDGQTVVGDLAVTFAAPAATALTTTDVAAINTAWGTTFADVATAVTAMNANITASQLAAHYASEYEVINTTPEIQTITIAAQTAGVAGTVNVAGYTIAVADGDTDTIIAANAAAAINADTSNTALGRATATAAAGLVTITYSALDGDVAQAASAAGTAVFDGAVATIPVDAVFTTVTQGDGVAVNEVETIDFSAMHVTADGNITLSFDGAADTTIVVLNGDSDAVIATKVAAAINGNDVDNIAGVETATAVAGIVTITHGDATNVAIAANGTATTALFALDTAYTASINATTLPGSTTVIDGTNSLATNDNTITGGTGDDVIVLATDNNATSEETVVFAGSFGKDTIVNFTTVTDTAGNANGTDALNFTSYMTGTTAITLSVSTVLTANNEILVTNAGASNAAPVITAADDTTAFKGLVLAVHTNDANVADVYTAVETDSASVASSVALTLVGTIDMADVAISDLALGNFTAL